MINKLSLDSAGLKVRKKIWQDVSLESRGEMHVNSWRDPFFIIGHEVYAYVNFHHLFTVIDDSLSK
jgi:hypothetical protein